MMFYDRKEAGELLGAALKKYQHLDPLIVAIPRGGVPVAYEVAKILKAPLDVAITKKIGHPFNSEYAIGALGINAYILNPGAQGIPEDYLHEEICRVKKLVQEKSNVYHKEFPVQEISGRWLILVDDGIATGSTILLTADILKKQCPAGIIIAVPVAPDQSIKKLEDNSSVNEVVCLHATPNFRGVGQFYENFAPVEDSEAMDLLRKAIPAEQ